VFLADNSAYVTQISLGEGAAHRCCHFPFKLPHGTATIKPALILLAVFVLIAISMIRYFTTSVNHEPMLELVDVSHENAGVGAADGAPGIGTRLRSSAF